MRDKHLFFFTVPSCEMLDLVFFLLYCHNEASKITVASMYAVMKRQLRVSFIHWRYSFFFFSDSDVKLLQNSTMTSYFPIFLQTWMSDNPRFFY